MHLLQLSRLPIFVSIVFIFLLPCALASGQILTLHLPTNLPPLHSSTNALLIKTGFTRTAPLTRANTFVFRNLTESGSYLLDIGCRDWDFAPMVAHVREEGDIVVGRRGGGDIKRMEGGGWEVRAVKPRDNWEDRGGFSPMSLLKNPMILIAVLGFGFIVGMPYLLDSMDPETRAEFEEQQKKSILNTGASGGNPLQNFDMAAWMAGKTSGASTSSSSGGGRRDGEARGEGGKIRRRG
ncbi:hypothetical protein MMC07_003959 [Pseudocyphellaria aurata]|nr:hypothetical protein [Pseudocyphellaria aurata]